MILALGKWTIILLIIEAPQYHVILLEAPGIPKPPETTTLPQKDEFSVTSLCVCIYIYVYIVYMYMHT